MAPDDDYWRWRDTQDERRWLADRHAEQRKRLNEALSRKDYRQAGWITGVPQADIGPDDFDALDEPDDLDDPDAAPGGEPQSVEALFREHKRALLFDLEWVYDFLLPPELREDWARRVEPLELAQAWESLAAIERLREEYRRAVERYAPANSDVSRRMDWDYFVPRIGEEIERVAALLQQALIGR